MSLAMQDFEDYQGSESETVKTEMPQGILNAIDAVKASGATSDQETIDICNKIHTNELTFEEAINLIVEEAKVSCE